MTLFTPTTEDKQIQKIQKCISSRNTVFDKLRLKIINELKSN